MKEVIQEIEAFCDATAKGLPNLIGIVLYGSYANGTPNEESDSDMLVVVEDKTKNDKTLSKIKDIITDNLHHKYAMQVLEEWELIDLMICGEVYFKHEVMSKGKFLYDRENHLANIRAKAFSSEPDYEKAEKLYRERAEEEIKNMRKLGSIFTERLVWQFSHLVGLAFARKHIEAKGLEDTYRLMEEDEALAPFADDFRMSRRLFKQYKHGNGFPFDDAKYLQERIDTLRSYVMDGIKQLGSRSQGMSHGYPSSDGAG